MRLPPKLIIPTVLFPDAMPNDRGRVKQQREPQRRSESLAPHLVIHIYNDGTAGAETILKDREWASIIAAAESRAVRLRAELAFIDQWLTLPRRERIELMA